MVSSPRAAITASALLLTATCALYSRVLSYNNALFSIDIPDHGWIADTLPASRSQRAERMLLVTSGDASVALEVYLVYDGGREHVLDDGFVATQLDDLESRGIVPRDTGFTMLGGIRAMRYGATIVPDSGMAFERYMVQTIANGAIYQLVASSTDGRPEANPDIRRMIESFAFIGTPILPDPERHGRDDGRESMQKTMEWTALGGLFIMLAVVITGFYLWRAWARWRRRVNDAKTWAE